MKKYLSLLLLNLGIISTAKAQTITLNGLAEIRTSSGSAFSNSCDIFLKINDENIINYKYAKLGRLEKAEDNTGKNLLHKETSFQYEALYEDQPQVALRTDVANREAKSITILKGEVVLYNPTESNGGLLKIENLKSKIHQNLSPTIPNLKIIYFTKDSKNAFLKDIKSKKEAELKKQPKETYELNQKLKATFETLEYYEDDPRAISLYIIGDAGKFVTVYFENTEGTQILKNGSMSSENVFTYYFNEEISPSWKLFLNVESEKSTKKIPFELKNIDLP